MRLQRCVLREFRGSKNRILNTISGRHCQLQTAPPCASDSKWARGVLVVLVFGGHGNGSVRRFDGADVVSGMVERYREGVQKVRQLTRAGLFRDPGGLPGQVQPQVNVAQKVGPSHEPDPRRHRRGLQVRRWAQVPGSDPKRFVGLP